LSSHGWANKSSHKKRGSRQIALNGGELAVVIVLEPKLGSNFQANWSENVTSICISKLLCKNIWESSQYKFRFKCVRYR